MQITVIILYLEDNQLCREQSESSLKTNCKKVPPARLREKLGVQWKDRTYTKEDLNNKLPKYVSKFDTEKA